MRHVNIKALQIIEEFEGLRLKPYLCPANVWTIGIGTTRYEDGTPVKKDDPEITPDRALELLKHDLKQLVDLLDKFASARGLYLGDNKFSALISFMYNVGPSPVITRGKLMHDGLIANDDSKIKRAFLSYTKITKIISKGTSKKVELPGLVKRRNAEMNLFFS